MLVKCTLLYEFGGMLSDDRVSIDNVNLEQSAEQYILYQHGYATEKAEYFKKPGAWIPTHWSLYSLFFRCGSFAHITLSLFRICRCIMLEVYFLHSQCNSTFVLFKRMHVVNNTLEV